MNGIPPEHAALEKEIVALMPAIKKFAARFERSATDAEDLSQDVMLKALAHIDQFQPGTSMKSWLFTIVRNTYCSKYKIRKRFVAHPDPESAAAHREVQSTQEWTLRAAEVRKAIAQLDPAKRRVLLMATNGDSYEHMAEVCGCEIGTIKSRIARARNAVMVSLGERTYSAAIAPR